jgi:hypothetical protein
LVGRHHINWADSDLNQDFHSITESRLRLQRWVESRGFRGADPYDGLTSKLLPAGQPIGKWGRVAWTQFFKWNPVNLRWLFAIPPADNAKGLGLFLQGFLELFKAGKIDDLAIARDLATRLEKIASKSPNGLGWGYPFPWQSRAFFLPAGTPTVVNTSFISHALLDLAEVDLLDAQRWTDLASQAGSFIMNDLNRTQGSSGHCLSYTQLDKTCIHNANLLGAGLLIRLARLKSNNMQAEFALECCRYSLKHQRDDGSWFYADTSFQNWIDSYHTVFNLMALERFQQASEGNAVDSAIRLGEMFLLDNLIKDGHVLYRFGQPWPVDIHAPASVMVYLADKPQNQLILDEVWKWTSTKMLKRDGSFTFLCDRKWWRSNRISYMRWGQSWMWWALCRVEASQMKAGKNG